MTFLAYELEIRQHLEKTFEKIAKRNPQLEQAIKNKLRQILENPFRFKPLHAPLQGLRRVHILGSFVLIYSIREQDHTVVIEEFDHHDKVYRK